MTRTPIADCYTPYEMECELRRQSWDQPVLHASFRHAEYERLSDKDTYVSAAYQLLRALVDTQDMLRAELERRPMPPILMPRDGAGDA